MSEETEFTDFQSMIDAAKKQGGSTEAPTLGKHQGVIKAAKYKTTSTGKLMISMLLQVTEQGENLGRQIWTNQTLSPGPNMHIFFKTMEACGIPLDWWKQFGAFDAASRDAAGTQLATLVKGNPVEFNVKMGTWKDEPRPEVGWINKGKGEGLNAPAAAAPLGSPAAAAAPLGAPAPAPETEAPERPF